MTATHDQIEMLLQFMQEHQDLAKGLVNSASGRAQSKALWDELSQRLNSLGGSVKTVKQWQKVWADRKYLSKKAAAACRRAQTGTGGGPSTQPPLSDLEQKVVAIMGEGFGMPQTSATIPAFENDNATEEIDNENDTQDVAQNTTQDPPPSTSRIITRRPRLRFRRQPDDVRTQLIRLEQKKIDELKEIRSYLGEITNLLYKCVDQFKKT